MLLRFRGGLFVGICALVAGCGAEPTGTPGTKTDLGVPLNDMGTLTDQAVFTGPDMVVTIGAPKNCDTNTVVTGTTAYKTLTNNGARCLNCHSSNNKPAFTNQATFMTATINVKSTADLPYVVPNNPDRSYLMYKLRNQQNLVRNGGGMQMPRGGTPLTDAELCVIHNWILHGAPTN